MNKLKLLLAAALLAMISNAASIAIPGTANPGIFGSDWRLEMNGPPLASPAKAEPCVYAGSLTLTRGAPLKDAVDKLAGEPVSGLAMMELVSGPCEEFPMLTGEILGGAYGDNVIFQMAIFPVEPAKDGSALSSDKGLPVVILTLEGELASQTLLRGAITDATLPPTKGSEFGFWRATRGTGVPAVTPVGILLLLGVFGLIGGIALYRRG
jgi:hypothetical protein